MMNRKETSAASLAVGTTSVWRRLSPVTVRTAREQEVQTQSFSKNDLLDNSGVWKQPLSIYEISPYKMAPRVFNGIIFQKESPELHISLCA